MTSQVPHQKSSRQPEVRWPAWVALFITALLYEGLPKILYWGPHGLMISLISVLIIPLIITHWRRHSRINRILGLSVNILITLYLIVSVIRIVVGIMNGYIGPAHLLISATALWTTNILVFALWYWNLDAGGPHQRELNEGHGIAAFLFPQTQISLTASNVPHAVKQWEPNFIDYLFLAFNTSIAFSPTDTPVLTRWAKCMSMIQAMISLTIISMLAARAINIITPAANYLVS